MVPNTNMVLEVKTVLTSKPNTIGEAISFNSSSAHYSPKFQRIKNRQERHPLIFQSDNTESYNQPFSIDCLMTALGKAHDTAPGPDQIHYQILKHLPEASLQCLLKGFDNIWETGEKPPSYPLPSQEKTPKIQIITAQ